MMDGYNTFQPLAGTASVFAAKICFQCSGYRLTVVRCAIKFFLIFILAKVGDVLGAPLYYKRSLIPW